VALVLVLQACNSLMLFANVNNALNAFANSPDAQQIGDIINTFWPPQPNQTINGFVIGETNVTWDVNQVYNLTYLQDFDPHEFTVLLFEIFSKIFQSYDLEPPDNYEHTLESLANGDLPMDNSTYQYLYLILINRFLVSAVYYLVACVRVFTTNLTKGIASNLKRFTHFSAKLAER
jgi:hypothetical protein